MRRTNRGFQHLFNCYRRGEDEKDWPTRRSTALPHSAGDGGRGADGVDRQGQQDEQPFDGQPVGFHRRAVRLVLTIEKHAHRFPAQRIPRVDLRQLLTFRAADECARLRLDCRRRPRNWPRPSVQEVYNRSPRALRKRRKLFSSVLRMLVPEEGVEPTRGVIPGRF